MNRKHEPAAWPFVLGLAVLFILSVSARRPWQVRNHATERRKESSKVAIPRAERKQVTAGAGAEPGEFDGQRLTRQAGQSRRAGSDDAAGVLPRLHVPANAGILRGPAPSTTVASAIVESTTGADVATPEHNSVGTPSTESSSLADTSKIDSATPMANAPIHPHPASLRKIAKKRAVYRSAASKPKKSAQQPHSVWGEPTALLEELDRLAMECDSGEWATRAGDVVRELLRCDDLQSPRTALALKRLRDLVDAKHPLLALPTDAPHRGELRRLRYAVLRRLDLWELVPELAGPSSLAKGAVRGQPVSLSSDSSRLAGRQTDVAKLLSDLERFEQTGLTDDGREVAADVSRLAAHEKLAARTQRWLEWNYRNSNLRLVVAHELLNRLVPVQPAVEEPVHDRILGIPTRGWSSSTARLSIRLIPDPRQIRFALEARGIVFARTASRRDPVTVYSNSDSAYLARKQFVLSSAGLQTWPTEAEVTNNSRLRSIETDFDDVPILGPIVEGIARAKHAETEPAVRRVARRKVAARVQEEIDSAMEPKLATARRLYQQSVVAPLAGLSLEPTVIEMQSTEARLTSRLRLAGNEQLASSTPRPMALTDSLASVQIHQSLVNNLCDRLDLDGRAFTLPELQQRLLDALKLPPESLSEEYPSDLRVTFAKRDAVIARFDQGRIELTLGIAELHKYPKSWRDFQVRVFYRPRVTGLDVRFVRDGTVQLRSERFGHEPQIALRGIFSKVFSHDRELVFLDAKVLADPRLAGLNVTQCTLTDGWIGLSLGSGPARQARRMVGPLY